MKLKNLLYLLITLSIVFIIYAILNQNLSNNYNENQLLWSKPELITKESNNDAYRANLLIDSNDKIHIAWKDKSNYNENTFLFNIYYRYKEIGANWSIPELVSFNENKVSHCLSMSIDKFDNIHIVWLDETDYLNSGLDKDIYYRYKTNNNNWSEIELVSNNSNIDCNCPSLDVYNETIHVIWPDKININNITTDIDIFYKNKKLSDTNWSNTQLVTKDSIYNSLNCEIEIDSKGIPHIVWQEKNSSNVDDFNYNIFYQKKENNVNISETQKISMNMIGNYVSPSIEIDKENSIHIIWLDNSGNLDSGKGYDVFYKCKKVNDTWSKVEILSNLSTKNCRWPYLKIDKEDNIHVAWADNTNILNSGNDYDIYYRYKVKDRKWSDIELVTYESINDSNWPRFDIDSNMIVHMSWWEESNLLWRIFYSYK